MDVVICRFYQQSNKLQRNLDLLKPLLKDGCDTRIEIQKCFCSQFNIFTHVVWWPYMLSHVYAIDDILTPPPCEG